MLEEANNIGKGSILLLGFEGRLNIRVIGNSTVIRVVYFLCKYIPVYSYVIILLMVLLIINT